MAEKSVFISKSNYPFFEEVHVTIDWFGGFALSQKRKCEIGLHQNFILFTQVKLLSPVVPCKFNREAVELFYAKHCGMLTNRKEQDNFLDLRADIEDGN